MSRLFLVLVGFFSLNVFAGPAISPGAFKAWVTGADKSRLALDEGIKASRYHYIFISGFLNEFIPGYFEASRKELVALGVPKHKISRFAPPSGRSFAYNAALLKEQVMSCVSKDGERVVIVAHSRGTIDALSFALENPNFMKASVEAMFLVQGSLKGSYLADYLEGVGQVPDKRMPQPYRAIGKVITQGVKFFGGWLHEGLVGLTHANMHKYWVEKLDRDREAVALISDKIFYVDSSRPVNKMAFLLRTEGTYLQTYYGENDGEVLRADMHLDGIGRHLATLVADHAGLFTPRPISNTSSADRRRFMRAIFRAVGQPEESY